MIDWVNTAGQEMLMQRQIRFVSEARNDFGATDRAVGRKAELKFAPVTFFDQGTDNLGNDVAGPLDKDPVADSEPLFPDEALIVQGRAGHGHTSDCDRFEHSRGCEHTGPADLDLDILQYGFGLMRRKLERHSPSGSPGRETEETLQVEAVQLGHQAVDFKGHLGSVRLQATGRRFQSPSGMAQQAA
jgi:hypothetical protein